MLGTLIRRYRRGLPSRLEDGGAVAVEFALLLPVQLLMFAGVFGIGAVMIEDAQLNFVVEGAAKVEAAVNGTGVAWASAQLPPPAAFVANPKAACGAQVSGQWPISLGIFPALTLSAQACWPPS
jgi:Flp pilus assembly protein TadG